MPQTNAAAASRRCHALDGMLCRAAGKAVLVIGDVMLDEYITGDVKRISPETRMPIIDFHARTCSPGGAGNVAANIRALGCYPLLTGAVGADVEAEPLRLALRQAGVVADWLLVDPMRPTTVKQRVMAHDRQIVRIDREVCTPIPAALENALCDWLENHVTEADACILSDYGKGVVTARVAQKTIALCRAAGVPVLVDPKSLGPQSCRGATLVKPNKDEAQRMVSRPIRDEASFLEVGRELAALLEGAALLITRGPLGMSLFRTGVDPFHVPSAARTAYDVTGAGDTAISPLAIALAAKTALEHAVVMASHSAAVVVEKLGTATVTPDELKSRSDFPASTRLSGWKA